MTFKKLKGFEGIYENTEDKSVLYGLDENNNAVSGDRKTVLKIRKAMDKARKESIKKYGL